MSAVGLYQQFEQLKEDTSHEAVTDTLESFEEDDHTITQDLASDGLEYLRELDQNWDAYDQPELFHGTRSTNLDEILDEGLIPGENNNSGTGERSDHHRVCFGRLPIALNYAIHGTPEPEDIQKYAERAYNDILGRDKDTPDISRPEGRERFSEDTEEISFWNLYSPLPNAVENYEEILESKKSDPVVLGAETELIEGLDRRFSDLENMSDSEIHNRTSPGLPEAFGDEIEPENLTIFVPHSKLEDYREDRSDQATVLSIEAMQMKHDYGNREFYKEHGTIEYDNIWNPESDIPFVFDSEIGGAYSASPIIPSTSK